MKFSVYIEWAFAELPHIDRIERAKYFGFNATELWYWKGIDLKLIKRKCEENSIEISNFTGIIENQMVDPKESEKCIHEFERSLEVAQFLNCKNMVIHVNTILDDMTAKPVTPGVTDEDKKNNILFILSQIISLAEEKNVTLCFEPLNTKVDHFGYYLNYTKNAFEIIREVNSKNLKLLYDW